MAELHQDLVWAGGVAVPVHRFPCTVCGSRGVELGGQGRPCLGLIWALLGSDLGQGLSLVHTTCTVSKGLAVGGILCFQMGGVRATCSI
jgi:hypothetical protein